MEYISIPLTRCTNGFCKYIKYFSDISHLVNLFVKRENSGLAKQFLRCMGGTESAHLLIASELIQFVTGEHLSLFLELKSTSSLAYTFFAILVDWSLWAAALDTNTMNHSRSSFWTINFRRGLRIVLNSSRS